MAVTEQRRTKTKPFEKRATEPAAKIAEATPVEETLGHILVVDDDASSRRGYELLLRMAGHRVTTAADGDEALEKVRGQEFDVVVSDVNMPKVDGFELTRQLRAESATRDVPIILLSAVANSSRLVRGLDRGADDFLEKPVDVDELLARIRMHLRHGQRQRELIERSRFDAVTGVLNRGAIDEELERELKRSERSGLPVSVLMIDIDGFKGFNDRYGHTSARALWWRRDPRRVARHRSGERPAARRSHRDRVDPAPTHSPGHRRAGAHIGGGSYGGGGDDGRASAVLAVQSAPQSCSPSVSEDAAGSRIALVSPAPS
jgi:DNA-binding response OmpR family regulator